MMKLTKKLLHDVAMEVNGTTVLPSGELDQDGKPIPRLDPDGNPIDLAKWQEFTMREAIIKWWDDAAGRKPTNHDFMNPASLSAWLHEVIPEEPSPFDVLLEENDRHPTENYEGKANRVLYAILALIRLRLSQGESAGAAIASIFEAIAEPHLIQPTIIYDFPLAVSPLSKQKPDEPDWVERFEFYIGGFELGNAFSELNDPVEQRNRFLQQLGERERGDAEAHAMDEDYVRALSFGLPPTGGEGIGIDRLTMVLTGSRSIRDVILFPLMRPQAKQSDADAISE
ncbi:MAG: amino acid--tRNA ligase-related protein [Acidobacteriaceae bacterium]